MRRFLGVPWSQVARSEYVDAMLQRETGDARKALDAHDAYLEVVSGRASALIGAYGIFLAISIFLIPSVVSPHLRFALEVVSVFQLVGVVLLFPCLWIVWRNDPKIYADTNVELRATLNLLMQRSILLNASVLISFLAILSAILLFVADRYLP